MLRYDDINEISDGRLYSENDMVRVDTNGCEGCSKCCESDMGNSIVLDPYDIFHMTEGAGKTFDELLVSFLVELDMIDNIVLPHIKMDNGCGFLNADKRCSIHKYRPSICRLFPLGRLYNDKGFDYILQTGECIKDNCSKIKVDKWLGIEDLPRHSAFINKWHRFLQFERKKVREIIERAENEALRISSISEEDLTVYAGIIGDSEILDGKGIDKYRIEKCAAFREEAQEGSKAVMKTVLRIFYMEEYKHSEDFFTQFDERLKKCLSELRRIN